MSTGSRASGRLPSVVLVSIDMMRADALADAPNLRKFAQKATTYENAYAQATYTLPSHMTLMTGVDPFVHGAIENGAAYPKKALMLAERLRHDGYQTAAFADGFVDEKNFSAGFDVFENAGHESSHNLAKAKLWLETRKDNRPFFLFAHTYRVHNHFRDAKGRRRSASEAYFAGETGLAEKYKRSYQRAVRQTDAELGDLLAALPPDARVVVTGDHGENMLELHAGGDVSLEHTMPWEAALRVPLVVRGAGTDRKESCVIGLSRIAPWLAGDVPAPACGPEPLFFVGRREGVVAGVRRGDLKLVVEYPSERARLFDVRADPGELRDLAPANPMLAADLRVLLERHMMTAGFNPRAPKPALDEKTVKALRASGYVQ